jgi:MFS family permease
MEEQLHSSRTLVLLGITFFTLTFGASPLLLAPISEVYGRTYLYNVSALVFTLFFIPQALARNIETMLISRFIAGIAGSSAVSLVGGTLADLWINEERGLPMALFAWSAFGSTGLGPVIFGYVEQFYDFRMINWIMLAISGAFTTALIVLLRETRSSVLLSRKAARLRKETGDDRYQCKADLARSSFLVMMKTSLTRPVRMLCTEPVLISFTLWISWVWGVLYVFLVAIPLVFKVSLPSDFESEPRSPPTLRFC